MARQRGNKWQADVLLDGVRQRKSFDTKEEAEAYEAAVEGGFKPSTSLTLRAFVDEVFDHLWGDAKSRSYIEGNWRVIYRYIPPTTMLDKITDETVDRMIAGMKRDGKQGGTINRKVANVNKLMKEARRRKRVMVIPEARRQPEGNARERVLSTDEERRAVLYFEHVGKPVAAHLFNFLLYTGCRIGEALELDRKRVAGSFVTFHHSTTKNSKSRAIPLVPKAKEAWDAVARASNSATPFGDLMPYWTFRDHWAALKGHLKVDDDEFVPHMLRHTCATRLVLKGVPLPHVMKWMGHRSIQVTMRYSHLVPHDLDLAAQALAA